MKSYYVIPINSFDINNIIIKPFTKEDIQNQKKNKFFTTFIYYNNNPFYLKCNDLKLNFGIPLYKSEIEDDKYYYNIPIIIDNNDINLKNFREKLYLIDDYIQKNRNIILSEFKNKDYDYYPLIKKQNKYDKINIKLPYDSEKKCFNENFIIYKLGEDKKFYLIRGIKKLDDLKKIIHRGAIIKPIIYFQKLWVSSTLKKWGITLKCDRFVIINEGQNNLSLGYDFDEEVSDDEFIINNTIIKELEDIDLDNDIDLNIKDIEIDDKNK